MTKNISEQARAAAESAIQKRQAVTNAKAAAEAAGGTDAGLNEAILLAEQEATKAESEAIALSQTLPPQDDTEKRKEKLLRKRKFINKDLKDLGVDIEDDEIEDEDDEEDLDKPVTRRELLAIETGRSRQTATQMAETIGDALDRAAVLKALPLVVPTADPEKDFKAAVAIANIERNSKILDEVARRTTPRTSPTGTGAPVLREEAFVPTQYEQMFMRSMGLTKEDILKSRAKAK